MPNIPLASFCLVLGALLLEWLPQLPARPVLVLIMIIALVAAWFRPVRSPAFILAGMAVMALAIVMQLDERLESTLQLKNISILATVDEFPVRRNGQVSLIVVPGNTDELPARIRLSWQDPAISPRLGETWRLEVRLRRPSGYANPGGFDYEGWLLRNRIGATGYVVPEGRNYRLHGTPERAVDALRKAIVRRLDGTLPKDEASAVMKAIVVGARHEITREQWDRYAATGTSHLIAISGLHIGLAAGAAFLFARVLLAIVPVRSNSRDLAIIVGLVVAVCYAALSGFAVPARRACLMLAIAGLLVLRRRELVGSMVLGMTAVLIFLTDPLSTLTPGFRMSFAAVAVLFVLAQRHLVLAVPDRHRWWTASTVRLALVQIGLLAGLMPLSVMLFERISIVAPLVNMLVLPIFNAITVPLALAGSLMIGPIAPAGDVLLALAHRSIALVLVLISQAADIDALAFKISVPVNLFVVCLPLLYILLPAGWPSRRIVLIAGMAIVSTKPDPIPPGCFRYDVLDVGQGLAVVVETHEHALLFDTGPAFQSGSNTVETVVLPFLHYSGIERLDIVLISHGDLDHAGGIRSLVKAGIVGEVFTGEMLPSMGGAQAQCAAGQQWYWNGVDFRILHPRTDAPWRNNNASCVLEVSAGERRLLLTGDIEAPVETLLQYRRKFRPSNVVVIPHHGSRTSSTTALVEETQPVIAIVSAGRLNRWGFPSAPVVDRWQSAGATVINTGNVGAVGQQLCRHVPPGPVETVRSGWRKVWHEAPPGAR